MSSYSTFLFATPTAVHGVGSVLDLGGLLGGQYNQSPDGDTADFRALWADSQAIIEDKNIAARELVDDVE